MSFTAVKLPNRRTRCCAEMEGFVTGHGSARRGQLHVRRHSGQNTVRGIIDAHLHPEYLVNAFLDGLHIARQKLRLLVDLLDYPRRMFRSETNPLESPPSVPLALARSAFRECKCAHKSDRAPVAWRWAYSARSNRPGARRALPLLPRPGPRPGARDIALHPKHSAARASAISSGLLPCSNFSSVACVC